MWVTLYTDASWFPETCRGGWGFWAKSNLGRVTKHGKLPNWVKCNNAAEMAAILIGVETIFSTWDNVEGILVCTDSTTAQSYLKYRPAGVTDLKRKDWLGIRTKLYQALDEKGCKLKIRHVKGHQANTTKASWLNNKVDEFTRRKT